MHAKNKFLHSFPPINPTESAKMKISSFEKQGILTVLGSDSVKTANSGSIRRTLSADMSSKKWLAQNGFFCGMERSSGGMTTTQPDYSSSSSEGEDGHEKRPGQKEIWNAMQSEKEKDDCGNTKRMDIWGSILSNKKDDSSPPYVHPSTKKSARSLSKTNLEICTESLGSETGSEGFSTPEILSDAEEEKRRESIQYVDLPYSKCKKSPSRAFPPPIPSIAGRDGAATLRMKHCRKNGSLVLEAVSVPSKTCFQAQRVPGRLLLTLIDNSPPSDPVHELVQENKVQELDEVFDHMDDEADQDVTRTLDFGGEEDEAAEKNKVEEFKRMSGKKKNPAWSQKLGRTINSMEINEDLQVPSSLPPLPPVARATPTLAAPPVAASFNAYEHFWRTSSAGFINHSTTKDTPVKIRHNKGECFIPLFNGCKKPRRSSLIWESYCIATS